MNELWFAPDTWSWLPGASIGMFGGILGAVTGMLVPAGRRPGLVIALYNAFIAYSALLLGTGLVALMDSQPMIIWAALAGPGVLGLILGAALLLLVRRVYAESNARERASENQENA
jgi:hypothetical protein